MHFKCEGAANSRGKVSPEKNNTSLAESACRSLRRGR